MTLLERSREEVLRFIDEKELVDLALAMGNINAPSGYEQPMADFVLHWLQEHRFQNSFQQKVAEGRSNVIGILKGLGGGKSLIFNSHMDSEQGIPDYPGQLLPVAARARIDEKGRVYGRAVLNDRGPMAAFMIAVKAIKDSALQVRGDIIMTMVVGEIGMAPVDEFQGTNYIGKGYGTRHLLNHGIWADYGLVAETTDFGVTWVEAGAAYFKITLHGRSFYTPRLPERGSLENSPNPIAKMIKVIEAVEQWAMEYERKYTTEYLVGTMVPKVSIGAIRGGQPFKPSMSARSCSIYLDVRIPPSVDFSVVHEELRRVVFSQGFGGEVECFMFRKGYEGKNIEHLVDATHSAYKSIRGEELPPVSSANISVWRDSNIFSEVGIPCVNFAPPRKRASDFEEEFIEVKDLVDSAKMYALTALDICA